MKRMTWMTWMMAGAINIIFGAECGASTAILNVPSQDGLCYPHREAATKMVILVAYNFVTSSFLNNHFFLGFCLKPLKTVFFFSLKAFISRSSKKIFIQNMLNHFN